MCEKGWCIGFDPEAEAEAQLRAEGKWKWDKDPADLGPMYAERGPTYYGPPIYDEVQAWYDYKKEGRIKRWLKRFRATT